MNLVAEADHEMKDKQLRHRETTGAIIIDTLGRFLFQLRDNVVGITNPRARLGYLAVIARVTKRSWSA